MLRVVCLLILVGCGPASRDPADDDVAIDAPVPAWGARLAGKVWGPGHVFPVYGALVSAYAESPPDIPSGAYCEHCVAAPGGESSTLSAADGTFTIQIAPSSTVYLVVQKGQFRQVTSYTAPDDIGDASIDESLTTLPNRNDPNAGATIPRIALVYGDYDPIQDVLAKVGIGDLDASYGLSWGSEAGVFDVFDNHGDSSSAAHGESLANLVRDPVRLGAYHLIFFTCSNNSSFAFMTDPVVQANLRAYVRGGGKLYVSDYAFPVIERVWPEFVWFTDPLHGGCNETSSPPNCNHGPPFDAPSVSLDPDASRWLLAIDPSVTGSAPTANLTTLENWNTIGATAPGHVGDDPVSGQPISQSPKVWVEGGWNYDPADAPPTFDRTTPHPMTLSFPFGCGRVMYTTYHTVGSSLDRHPGLKTQELLLWQLVLELTVCSTDVFL